jgi:outer membrane lipoprotein carrier protein
VFRLSSYLLFLLLPAAVGGDSRSVVKRMESRYRAAKTLEATFLEQYEENGRVLRVASGTAYFRRPGKMRWEYQAPEKNVFLVDGKTAWFYVPGDHTVTRVPVKESMDLRTPLALLAGEMKVSRVCARVWVAPAEKPQNEDDVVLHCALRGEQSSAPKSLPAGNSAEGSESRDAVIFEIVRASGDLVRLVLRARGGIKIEFRFQNWQMNPLISEDLFHFQPPRGVAIVNGELPADPSSLK